MTVIMTFFGTLVFVFSCFTVGFKPAMKRLLTFAGIGAVIDIAIIGIANLVTLSLTL
jgi:hypothetical protein